MIRTTTTAETDLPLDAIWEELAENAAPYVGRWNRLISTTNWEKGKIICQWRETLVESEAAATEYSDEAWSRLVGGVTGQHVGRLRRVYQRFGDEYDKYEGVYWSHFQAALDWDDAEMWLEGAVQNGWSVSQTRAARWEALGAPEELKPREEDVISSDWDEDSPLRPPAGNVDRDTTGGESSHGDFHSDSDDTSDRPQEDDLPPSLENDESPLRAHESAVRPLAGVPELPDDLADAFEQFKIAILAHKLDGWRDTTAEDVITSLDALKQLAMAPA